MRWIALAIWCHNNHIISATPFHSLRYMAQKNHCFWSFPIFILLLVFGCGELDLPEGIDDTHQSLPGNDAAKVDTLIATNDTARFYLSRAEICNVMLSTSPTPSNLIENAHYRMPTKLEVFAVLRTATMPKGYWQSGQRILCYDTPADGKTQIGSTHFGTGKYYTYVPNGAIVKAGVKTNYCILPIRTEPLNTQTDKITIEINDQWND